MNRPVYIYVINDPRTGLVRYVGKTADPKQRFRKHLTAKNKSLSSKWIRGMLDIGLKPTFEIIDECTEADWQEKERRYIILFKSIGAKLLNQMPGGEGGPTMLGRKLTPEQANKISLSKIGKPNPNAGKWSAENLGIAIYQFKDGILVAEHKSIRAAARAINRSQRRFQMLFNNGPKKVNHIAGFTFKRVVNEADD